MHKLEFFEGHSGWFSQSIWIQWSSVGLSHFFLKTNGCTSKQSKCPVTGGLLRERLRKKNNSTWGPTSLIEGLTPRMNSSSCHLIVNHPKRFKWKLYQTHSNHWQSNYSLIKKIKTIPRGPSVESMDRWHQNCLSHPSFRSCRAWGLAPTLPANQLAEDSHAAPNQKPPGILATPVTPVVAWMIEGAPQEKPAGFKLSPWTWAYKIYGFGVADWKDMAQLPFI